MRIRVGVCNVMNTPDMPRRKVVRCGEIMADLKCDFVGYQEIREHGEDFHDIEKGMGPGYSWRGKHTPNPVAVSDRFKIDMSLWTPFHPGYKSIPTPARGSETVLAVKHRLVRRDITLAINNSHYINGAFNRQHRDTRIPRYRLWHHSMDIHGHLLEDFCDENAVVIGDFTRAGNWLLPVPGCHPVRWVAGKGGIIKVGVMEKHGWRFYVKKVRSVQTPSDHNALVVDLRLRRNR